VSYFPSLPSLHSITYRTRCKEDLWLLSQLLRGNLPGPYFGKGRSKRVFRLTPAAAPSRKREVGWVSRPMLLVDCGTSSSADPPEYFNPIEKLARTEWPLLHRMAGRSCDNAPFPAAGRIDRRLNLRRAGSDAPTTTDDIGSGFGFGAPYRLYCLFVRRTLSTGGTCNVQKRSLEH